MSRRRFVQMSAACVAAGVSGGLPLQASALGLPIGLQLYSVREQLAVDFAGTLRRLAALGYQEVEAAGFFGHPAAEVKAAMAAAGLRCVSGHYSWDDLAPKLQETIDYHHALGAEYIICSFPGFKNPGRLKDKSYAGRVQSFLLEDWRWNAERFNEAGKVVAAAGLKFGYHNHTMEFAPQNEAGKGVVPFDELLRLTDPALVTIEMDCGWVSVGGGDPVAYLRRYPERISMLHVKDFKHAGKPATVIDPPPAAELGKGTVDFAGIFAAAKKYGHIRHAFVEQEAFDMEPFAALRIDAEYMKALKA